MAVGRSSGRSQDIAFGQIANDLQKAAFSFGAMVAGAQQLYSALNVFRELNRQLTLTNAIANGTAENFRQMDAAVRSFALGTTFTASQSANALLVLSQAGLSVNQSLTAMSGVLTLAQATLEDVNSSADLLASTLTAFQLQAGEASRVSNLFAASMNQSLASLPKLAFALRQVGPVAGSMGISLEETTAALNELFNVGLRGEQAGTALRNVMVNLISPTGEAGKIMKTLGIQLYDTEGKMRSLFDVLKDLAKYKLSDSDLASLFGREALAGGTALLNSATNGNLDRMKKNIEGTSEATRVALEQMNSLDAQIKQAQNAIDEFRVAMGEQFSGTISTALGYITDLAIAFRELDAPTKAWFTTLGTGLVTVSVGLPIFAKLAGAAGSAVEAFAKFAGKTADSAKGFKDMASAVGDFLNPELRELRSISAGDFGAGFVRALPAVGALVTAVIGVGGLIYAFRQARKAAEDAALDQYMGDAEEFSKNISRSFSNLRQMNAANSDPEAINAYVDLVKVTKAKIEEARQEMSSVETEMQKLEDARKKIIDIQQQSLRTGYTVTGNPYDGIDKFLDLIGSKTEDPAQQAKDIRDALRSEIEPVLKTLREINPYLAEQYEKAYEESVSKSGMLTDVLTKGVNVILANQRQAIQNAGRAVTGEGADFGGLVDAMERRNAQMEKEIEDATATLNSSKVQRDLSKFGETIRKYMVENLTNTLRSAKVSEADAKQIVASDATQDTLTKFVAEVLANSAAGEKFNKEQALTLFKARLVQEGAISSEQLNAAASEAAQARLSLITSELQAAVDKNLRKAEQSAATSRVKLAAAQGDKEAEKTLRDIEYREKLANSIIDQSRAVEDAIAARLRDVGNTGSAIADVLSGAWIAEALSDGSQEERERALSAIKDAEVWQQELQTRLREAFGQENLSRFITEELGSNIPNLDVEELFAPMVAIQDAIAAGSGIKEATDASIKEMAEYFANNVEVMNSVLDAAKADIEGLNNKEKAQLAAETIAYLNGEPFAALADGSVRQSVLAILMGTGTWLEKVEGVVGALYNQVANLVNGVQGAQGGKGAGWMAGIAERMGLINNDAEIKDVMDRGRKTISETANALQNLQNAADIRTDKRKTGGSKGKKGKTKEEQLAELRAFLAERNKNIIESALELAAFGEDYNIDEIIDLRVKEIDADYTAQIEKARKEYERMFRNVKAGSEDHKRLIEMRDKEIAQLETLKQKNLDYANSAEFAARAQAESAQRVLDKYIEMNTYTGSFFQGLAAGAQQQILNMTTSFQQGMDTMRELVDGFVGFGNDMFAGFFEQVATGQKSMGDLLRETTSKMLMQWAKYFADLALKYVADWALKQALGIFGGAMGGMGTSYFPPVPSMGGGMPYAKGGAFDVTNFAKGGVVSRPQYFGFQREHKVGQRGEAGQEGVLPLARNSKGQLGVMAMTDNRAKSSEGGRSLTMTNSTTLNLPSNGQSEERDYEVMRRVQERQKETAMEVITEELRPGGLLYGRF